MRIRSSSKLIPIAFMKGNIDEANCFGNDEAFNYKIETDESIEKLSIFSIKGKVNNIIYTYFYDHGNNFLQLFETKIHIISPSLLGGVKSNIETNLATHDNNLGLDYASISLSGPRKPIEITQKKIIVPQIEHCYGIKKLCLESETSSSNNHNYLTGTETIKYYNYEIPLRHKILIDSEEINKLLYKIRELQKILILKQSEIGIIIIFEEIKELNEKLLKEYMNYANDFRMDMGKTVEKILTRKL